MKYPSSPNAPYTSSVEICTNLFSEPSPHALFAVSNNVCVPITFVLVNTNGFFILLSTCDSAAKCITPFMSYSLKISCIFSKSHISACIKVILSFTLFKFARFPAYVNLSTTTTL